MEALLEMEKEAVPVSHPVMDEKAKDKEIMAAEAILFLTLSGVIAGVDLLGFLVPFFVK